MRHRVLVAVAVAVLAVGLSGATPTGPQAGGGDAEAAPGTQVAGAIDAEGVAVSSAVDERRFATDLRRAEGDRSRAGVVAARQRRLAERLDRLETERDRLAGRANASAGDRVAAAALAARVAALRRALNRTLAAAADLPPAARRARGVNVSRLRQLRGAAADLARSAVVDRGRRVVGPPVAPPAGPGDPGGPPDDPGPPGDGNRTTDGAPGPDARAPEHAADVAGVLAGPWGG